MAERNPPAGDADLSGARTPRGEVIKSGGAGPSGSSFSSTGHLGGMGSTSDGVESTDAGPEPADKETGGVTDSDRATLADVMSDITPSDFDGTALDRPDDPDDRPASDDEPPADLISTGPASGDRASGRSPSRSPVAGGDSDVGATGTMTGGTGGQAGTSR